MYKNVDTLFVAFFELRGLIMKQSYNSAVNHNISGIYFGAESRSCWSIQTLGISLAWKALSDVVESE